MQIVVPMAGLGERFMADGYTDIKPLIPIHGKPMITYVIDLFPGKNNFIFLCNNDQLAHTPLAEVLKKSKPHSVIYGITPHTKGPVYTVLANSHHIHDDLPTIVTYCDFNIHWDYHAFERYAQESGIDGALLCYTGFHPHLLGPNFYAGVLGDSTLRVQAVKEKFSFTLDKESGWHSCGIYYFKSGRLMKQYFSEMLSHAPHENGEYYASMPYNLMIRDRLDVRIYPIKFFCQWGTPKDLAQYTTWQEIATLSEKADHIGKQVDCLKKKIPEISNDNHQKALAYWRAYNHARH